MNFYDKDEFEYSSVYRCGIKSLKYFFHIAYLETCKSFDLIPNGLLLNKKPFISFITDDLEASWEETIKSTERQLLETLILGINEKRIALEE